MIRVLRKKLMSVSPLFLIIFFFLISFSNSFAGESDIAASKDQKQLKEGRNHANVLELDSKKDDDDMYDFMDIFMRALESRDQTNIIRKLLRDNDSPCDLGENKIQRERGYCYGFSVVWLYSKWLQFNYPEMGEWIDDVITDILGKHSDCKSINKLVAFFNKVQSLQTTKDIDDIITAEIKKLDLIPDEKKLQKEYTITLLINLEKLIQLLSMEGIVQEDKLILINSHNHTTALFKHNDVYYYFDPNNRNGEVKTKSIGEVAWFIFRANMFNDINSEPLALEIFTFGDVDDYPPQLEVLRELNVTTDPKFKSSGGYTLLMLAASHGVVEIVEFLLEDSRVDPNIKSKHGRTALMFAVEKGHVDTVKLLLEDSRVDPNVKDIDGWTELMYAAKEGHVDTVKLLLEDSRVDPNAKNEDGLTALMYVAWNGHVDTVKLLLEDSRVDPNAKNEDGLTALMYVAWKGDVDTVKLLLEDSRVDPNVKEDGMTALMIAAMNGHIDTVKLLLEDSMVDPNIQKKFGMNALMFAARNGHVDTVKLLLEDSRVDPNAKDENGRTAFMHAVRNGYSEVVEIFEKRERANLSKVFRKVRKWKGQHITIEQLVALQAKAR